MAVASIHRHNQTVLNSLEEGDMVEFSRIIYSHWAVYVGNGEVVHLTGDLKSSSNVNFSHAFVISGERFAKAKVKRENFFDVAADSKARKNNDKDNKVSPSDKQTIVQRALSRIGQIGYNILWANCENFASWCRYGEGWSEQTITALKAVGVTALVAAGATLLYNIFSSKKDEKN